MENEKYNGWSNYDTWLVMVWLLNDYDNYKAVCNWIEGIGTKKLVDYTETEVYDKLKRFHYGDKINWNNVNINEVKEGLLEE